MANNIAYGSSQPLINVFPEPVRAQRAPTVNDKDQIGRLWIDEVNNQTYTLTSITNNQANWTTNTTSGTGTFAAVVATAGNVTVNVGNVVVTLGNVTAGGSMSSTGSYTSVSGDIAALAGDVRAENNLIATTGNITASAGSIAATLGSVTAGTSVNAGTTITSAGDITSTNGSIITTVGNFDSGNTITAISNITSTTGNIAATTGAVTAGGSITAGNGLTVAAGDLTITTGNLAIPVGGITLEGDVVSNNGILNGRSLFVGTIILPVTTSSDGYMLMNGAPSLHGFGGQLGFNIFLGKASGNFTFIDCFRNTGIGGNALHGLTSNANENSTLGYQSLVDLTTGIRNSAIGTFALNKLVSGSYNSALGYEAGSAYTIGESSNICIGNSGVMGESNTIRLGTDGGAPGQQTKCYIAGDVYAARSLNSTTGTFANSVTVGTANILSGAGDPNGVVTATKGSLYLNLTGSGVADRAWINTNGGTVWTNLTTAA